MNLTLKQVIKYKLFWFFQKLGISVLPLHYYNPIPDLRELKKNQHQWFVESDLPGVLWDIDKQKEKFVHTIAPYIDEIELLPRYEDVIKKGLGQGYGPIESAVLYGTIRHIKPATYLEIGSGISTYYARLALDKNASEGKPGKIVCIEPYPFSNLDRIIKVDTLYRKKLEEIDIQVFLKLKPNDLIFVNSSYTVKIANDVTRFYLEILPRLQHQITIHIHDITYPFPTGQPEYWIYKMLTFWSESALVQAVLQNNSKLTIEYCLSFFHHKSPDFLGKHIRMYDSKKHYPSSLYIQTQK